MTRGPQHSSFLYLGILWGVSRGAVSHNQYISVVLYSWLSLFCGLGYKGMVLKSGSSTFCYKHYNLKKKNQKTKKKSFLWSNAFNVIFLFPALRKLLSHPPVVIVDENCKKCFQVKYTHTHIYKYICEVSEVKVAQLCLTLYDPMDYTAHGLLQVRILECVAFTFSNPEMEPRSPTLQADSLPAEPQKKPIYIYIHMHVYL